MKKLSLDFEIVRYGMRCRLVTVDDAPFINKLRSNTKLVGMIHTSEDNVLIQRAWIDGYKRREADGLEYYLLFEQNGEAIGVYRIYNINWKRLSYTGGSWICKPGLDFESVAKTILLAEDVAFDVLGLKLNIYEVQKVNKKVLRFHRDIVCAEEYGETEHEILFCITDNIRKRNTITQLLDLV